MIPVGDCAAHSHFASNFFCINILLRFSRRHNINIMTDAAIGTVIYGFASSNGILFCYYFEDAGILFISSTALVAE